MQCCTQCGITKNLSEFHNNKNYKNGKMRQCKLCRKKKNKNKNYAVSVTEKKCCMCKESLPSSKFHRSRHNISGLQNNCKECQHIKMVNYYKKGGVAVFIKRIFREVRHNAKKRNIKVDITFEDLLELYKKQEGKCALTGIKMTYEAYKSRNGREINKHNISIDRIDSNGHYELNNIQLVTTIINHMKWDLKQDDFIETCKIVAKIFKD